jgi:hypothetical protein
MTSAKPASSNPTAHDTLLPRSIGEDYASWLQRQYHRDIAASKRGRKKGDAWCWEEAERCVLKQVAKHARMGDLLAPLLRRGDRVVSPGAGFAQELDILAFLIRDYGLVWTALEVQPNLVALGNESRRMWGSPGRTEQWDVYTDPMPAGDVMYLCHFCGGGTDKSLTEAIRLGYRAVVVTTCCSHRMLDLSHVVHARLDMAERWEALAKLSADKQSEAGREAQKQIDGFRCCLLEEAGYKVEYGWLKDKDGNELPAGGYIIATKE